MASDLGICHVAYLMLDPASGFSSLSNYPREWIRRYGEWGYHRIDPVIQVARRSVRPFRWGPGQFPHTLQNRQRVFLGQAERHGLRHGLAIPMHGPFGSFGPIGSFGVLNLVDADAGRLWQATRKGNARLFAAAYDLHVFLLRDGKADSGRMASGEEEIRLTERERECLWAALEGHAADQAAVLLGLSVSSIHRYSSNAQRKLNCGNKYQAAVRAMRLGLL